MSRDTSSTTYHHPTRSRNGGGFFLCRDQPRATSHNGQTHTRAGRGECPAWRGNVGLSAGQDRVGRGLASESGIDCPPLVDITNTMRRADYATSGRRAFRHFGSHIATAGVATPCSLTVPAIVSHHGLFLSAGKKIKKIHTRGRVGCKWL